MIAKVIYKSGAIAGFDRLQKKATRLQLIASLMTVTEMRKFFLGAQSGDVVHSLGLQKQGSEKANCELLYKHFTGE